MNILGLPAVLLGFVIVQLACGALLALARWQSRERPPVTRKLLRLPGEYERVRLDFLAEQIRWLLLATSGLPVLILVLGTLAVANRSPDDHGLTVPILTVVGSLLTAGVSGFFLYGTLTERRRRSRALQGHRIVQDSLAPLIPSGFKIFHDVTTESTGPSNNVHHLAGC